MRTVSLEELLEAGCHFGHQVSRQNSKAKDYIFEARDKIHIIDLEKTKEGLEEAAKYIKDVAKRNGTLLVLGTKRQAATVIEEEQKRLAADDQAGMYFVTKRWIGGTLTNYGEVAKNFKRLKDLTAKLHDPKERAKYKKKELALWDKERAKLDAFYGGIADMPAVPSAIFIIDTHQEHVAAGEALRAGVPTVGITDTNADPTIISYPIPANDDAVGSLKLIISYIFDAWAEGKKAYSKDAEENAAKEAAAKAKQEKEDAAKKAEETKKPDLQAAAIKRTATQKTEQEAGKKNQESSKISSAKATEKKASSKK